jgi:hypothetical protein
MRIRSFIAAALIAALGATFVAPAAHAAESTSTGTAPRVNFDKAIARAVEQSSAARQPEQLRASQSNAPASQRGYGGGGGGHVMMAMSIVGMLAGVGMTYYMVKQMQKATKEASQGQ